MVPTERCPIGAQRLDLIDLAKAPPLLRFEIIKTGRFLYALSDEIENRFESVTIQIHHDMATWRRRQEEQLRKDFQAWSSNDIRSPLD